MALTGILTLALQNSQAHFWHKSKTKISLALGIATVFIFIISSQPYSAVFSFTLLIIKLATLIKRQ
jgi:hypothetical protein